MRIPPCLRVMRPHHCIKNLLLMVPIACGGELSLREKLIRVLVGFLIFSFLSSTVYIINDIRDLEKDRLHPTKCRRPIASGAISVQKARLLAAGLILLAAGMEVLLIQNPLAHVLFLAYFLMNLGYSFGLKHIPLLDVTALVSGFLLRLMYGACIADIRISSWLYLTVITLSFYFAFGKRRNELQQTGGSTRKVLHFYTKDFLDKNMYLCLSLSIAFYALWSMDETTQVVYHHSPVWSVALVLLICMRYSMDVEQNSDGDPIEVLLHDKWLCLICLIYCFSMLAALYL